MTGFHMTLPALRLPPGVRADDLFQAPLPTASPPAGQPETATAAPPVCAAKAPPTPVVRKSAPAQFRASDVTRAIKAVRKAGQMVTSTEITRDGTIRIITGDSAEPNPQAFDRWKAKRDAHSA